MEDGSSSATRFEIATYAAAATPLEPSSPSQDYRHPYGSTIIVDGADRPAMTVRSVGRHGDGGGCWCDGVGWCRRRRQGETSRPMFWLLQ